MEEVRQLVQEEGREARNLVTFHVAVDTPARVSRKPPRYSIAVRQPPTPVSRLRSASAGRDKRSELRARYWALLFGDLQRAIGEIYNTVEVHENPNECQEVILVLENYTRDFKALGEWFRLKWEYDNTPPPQRPQSLAWEIRKTDFVRLEPKRTLSVKTSPSVSGKNSPCLSGHNTPSGKNSPNLTGKVSPGSGKVSPKIASHASTSPKGNIEFFSNKIAGTKITAKPEARLSDIKEKETKDISVEYVGKGEPQDMQENVEEIVEGSVKVQPLLLSPIVEIGKAKECANAIPKPVIIKHTKPTNLNSAALNDSDKVEISQNTKIITTAEFLANNFTDSLAQNDNQINKDFDKISKLNSAGNNNHVNLENDGSLNNESPVKSDDHFADISNESSNKSEAEKSADKSSSDDKPSLVLPEMDVGVTHKIIKDLDKCNDVHNAIVKVTNHLIKINDKEKRHQPQDSESKCNEIPLKHNDVEVKKNATVSDKQQPYKDDCKKDHDVKKQETKAVESKVVAKPAYSQAAAKPKPPTKTEVKTPTKSTTSLTRSKTVVEMRPNVVPKTLKQFTKKNQTSKCSYPFNLTTGRTSLFDTALANKGTASKKPSLKNIQMAAGDAKPNAIKTDPKDQKKRPSRPTSLKITEKGDRKDKLNRSLGNISVCDDYSSTDTIVAQIDISRIESSESLKTLVPEDSQVNHDVGSSIEVLNVDNKSDNEGWLTVKSKRVTRESKKHSKSHWSNRFNQPSATTSLPTLNMMESPKQETSPLPENGNGKQDRAKSEQPQNIDSETNHIISELDIIKKEDGKQTEHVPQIETIEVQKPRKTEKPDKPERIKTSRTKPELKVKIKDLCMIRQKSDVTGLKTRSARTKALNRKAEKAKDRREESKLTKNRLHSSLESLTTGLARSQESTEDAFDFDKWKEEFKCTFKYLDEDDQLTDHNEILKTADPSEMSEIAEMTSLIEENERKISLALDFQTDVDQQKLCEEEDSLNRQIMELQQGSDIDVDTETDDTETDAEISSCGNAVLNTRGVDEGEEALGTLAASLETQYEQQLQGMSWAERVDTLVVLEALVARDPGRAQQLHAKLSQGIKRRGSLQDALRRLQAKQARAERQRLELQTERSKKIHQLLARVEEVKVAKNQLIEEKRLRMERRLQKAAENRDQHLKDIVRKAHDEEEKLREIVFITELQQQHRRHEFVTHCLAHTARLRAQRREQLKRLEQKAAREAAVGARRLALEEARARHVQTLLVRSRERGARGQTMREMKRQERGDAAREKAEGVKSRLSALAAAAELEADALRERIRDKQDASQQRLENRLRAIRDRAANRVQTLSESQEQDDIEEEAARLEREKKEREKQKAMKKRARKIKQKLLAISNEKVPEAIEKKAAFFSYDPFSNAVSTKMHKSLAKINGIIQPVLQGAAPTPDEYSASCTDLPLLNDTKKSKKQRRMANGDAHRNNDQSQTSEDNNQTADVSQTSDVKSDIDNNNTDAKPEETSKKRRKRNRDVDRARQSQTNSVCSSLTDTSRNSNRGRRQGSKGAVDSPLMERHFNELHRILERIDKFPEGRLACDINNILEVIGNVLALVDENEEFASFISVRCLTIVVTLRSRLCTGKLVGNLRDSVHLISIFNQLMDKDTSDIGTKQLIRQICDSLSLSMDMAVCTAPPHRAKARQHTHSLVSYLCLSGCLTKAASLIDIRDSIQTLLTVIADLCRPEDDDIGSERVVATQSLRAALGSSLCGSRDVLCALFAAGAVLEHSSEFVKAARTAHLLKQLAMLDHVHVQESFGEGGWPLEFRAAVSRLLMQHAPNDKQAPSTGIGQYYKKERLDQKLSETMVLDLIELVGYVVVNNPTMQETILPGWNVVKIMCTLPANWLVSEPNSRALLPTLLALAQHEPTKQVICAELSYKLLEEFYSSVEAKEIKLIQLIKQGKNKKSSSKK